jgi:excisionase family DNA binding protein
MPTFSPIETTTLLTEREVATLFQVTSRTVQRWAAAGTLDPVRVHGTTRYRADEVAALIHPSTSEAPAGNQGFAKTDDDGVGHDRG